MRRLIALLAMVGAMLVVLAGPAAAFPGIPGVDLDCKNTAPIASPDSGVAAMIDRGPTAITPGTPGEPGGPSLYETHGWGGASWFDGDPSCFLDDAPYDTTNSIASGMLALATIGSAVVVTLTRLAFSPQTWAPWDVFIEQSVEAFGVRLFLPLFVIAAALTVVLLAKHAHKSRTAHVATGGGILLALAVAGLFVVTWPLVVAPQVDKVVVGIVGEANSAVANPTAAANQEQNIGDKVGANIWRAVVYETWANGMFGDASSATAKEWGPLLYQASTLSRAEAAAVKAGTADLAELRETKRGQINDIAKVVKDRDPTAAEYLTGERNGQRIGFGLIGIFAFICVGLVGIIAAGRMLYSLALVRVGMALGGLLVLLGALEHTRPRMVSAIDKIATSLLMGVVSGIVAAAHVGAVGGFLSHATSTDPLITTVLIGLLTAALIGVLWSVGKKQKQERKRRNVERSAKGPAGADPQDTPVTPGGPAPAETGFLTSTVGGAFRGAAGGAATTAALGLLSSGTLTAAAVMAGAARGGAVGAVGGGSVAAALGTSTAATTAIAGTPAAALPAAPSEPATQPTVAAGGRPAIAAAPAPAVPDPGPDVFRPTDTGAPTAPTRVVEPVDGVYEVFTP